jgi:nitrogen fixation protein FixH
MTTAAPRVLTGRRIALIALAFFLTFLIPNIVLMWTAIGTFSGLVVSDSYTASQQFDRLRAAQVALGWTVEVDQADDVLAFGITDAYGHNIRPATLAVTVGRPTTSRSDQPHVMEATPTGYPAHAPLAPGSWRVEISATATDGTACRQSRDIHVRPKIDR